ncbi:MAG: hypothetical protein K8R67_03975 [Desulfobacteraceae bacterium]|nr:hypothetical protein [Desulfobacteraceae bacterium]
MKSLRLIKDDYLDLKSTKTKNQQAVRFSNKYYLKDLKKQQAQAVIKVVKNSPRGNKVKGLLEYIAREDTEKKDSVELETSGGEVIQNKEEIKELYQDWAKDFERKPKGSKRTPRHVEHVIFSADCKKTKKNILKVRDSVKELAANNFQGYDYAFGIHQDGTKPHVHLVIKSKSRDRSLNKLRLRKKDLFSLRQEFAIGLTQRGLPHSATLIRDRIQTVKANQYIKSKSKTWFQIKLKDINQEVALLKKQHNKIAIALKTVTPAKKERLLKKRDAIGERVNQLKRNIKERTTPDTIQRRQAFNSVRKLERELKNRDPEFKKIIKRADQLKPKKDKLLIDKTPSQLKEFLNNLKKQFAKLEKANQPWKSKPTAYKDDVKFIGKQINQLKINVKQKTKEGSKERLDSFNAIRKLERDLKKRDPRFKKFIKRAGDLKPKRYSMTEKQADRLSESLEESKKTINKIPDPKERRAAKKELNYYAKQLSKASPKIKRSIKNIKKKQRGIGL